MNQVITYTEQETERDSANEIHALVQCSFLLDVPRHGNAEVYMGNALNGEKRATRTPATMLRREVIVAL